MYLLLKQALEFPSTVAHTQSIRRVDHPDHRIGRVEIVAPVRSEGCLATYVPCKAVSSTFGYTAREYEQMFNVYLRSS